MGLRDVLPESGRDRLGVEPRRQAEEREEPLRIEEERELDDAAVGDLEHLQRPRVVAGPVWLGLYCPNAGEPFAAVVGMTREPRHSAPGPTHHAKMSSRPLSHRSYGGIDWVASSWIRAVSASMS